MKRIYKQIKGIMVSGTYNHYRLIVTPDVIELKLRPKSNKEEEINWLIDNDKDDIESLYWQLKALNAKTDY